MTVTDAAPGARPGAGSGAGSHPLPERVARWWRCRACARAADVAVGRATRDLLVVLNHLGDDEVEPFLGKGGIEVCPLGQGAQALRLPTFALGIRRRKPVSRLQPAHLLSELEPLGKQVNQSCIDVVDALPDACQLFQRFMLVLCHSSTLARPVEARAPCLAQQIPVVSG